jgi:hypothetical protein
MKNLFVIPQKTQSVIATIENNQIVNLGAIDIPYVSKTVYCQEHGIFVSINFKEKALKIYRDNGEYIGFNNQFNFSSIAIKGDVVYLGGAYKKKKNGLGELCSFLDLGQVDFKFKQINLPIIAVKNKAIDDIVIIGDKLILLDNIVFPKYIFEFDISNPRVPIHTNTINLPDNGTYEHIVKGDGNEKWLGIKSSTVGSFGCAQHLTILGDTNIKVEYLEESEESIKYRQSIELKPESIRDDNDSVHPKNDEDKDSYTVEEFLELQSKNEIKSFYSPDFSAEINNKEVKKNYFNPNEPEREPLYMKRKREEEYQERERLKILDELANPKNENEFNESNYFFASVEQWNNKSQEEKDELIRIGKEEYDLYLEEEKEWNNRIILKHGLRDFFIVEDNLYLLTTEELFCYDLTKYPDNRELVRIETKLTKMLKLIKTAENRIAVVSAEGYELIK